MADDVPTAGVIVRSAFTAPLVVARFEEVDRPAPAGGSSATFGSSGPADGPGATERMLLPDFAAMKAPLRMRLTTSAPERQRGGLPPIQHQTLSLQDASGEHSFSADKQNLDSHYIVVIKEPSVDGSGRPVYSAMPVSGWFNFARSSTAPQLDPEEQGELYEQLQALRRRPTAADALRQRLRGDAEAAGREGGGDATAGGGGGGGGRRGGAADDDDDDMMGQDNYRAAMAAAAAAAEREGAGRKRGREGEGDAAGGLGGMGAGASASSAAGGGAGGGGAGGEDGGGYGDDEGGPGEFLDDIYAAIDGQAAMTGMGGGGGGGGGGDAAAAGIDGTDLAGGREFDVVGMEGGGEEVAIDYEPDWDDDAGDKGDQYADAHAEGGVLPVLSAADLAQGEAALTYDGEEAAAREDEEEAAEGDAAGTAPTMTAAQRRAAEAAAKAAAAAAAAAGEPEVEAGRAVKRARLEAATPLGQLRDELRRLIVSLGGRITMKAISKHYKKRRETEGEAFQQLLVAALKGVTRRVLLADQSVEYILKE